MDDRRIFAVTPVNFPEINFDAIFPSFIFLSCVMFDDHYLNYSANSKPNHFVNNYFVF